MKLTKACFAWFAPFSLMWACGSSSGVDATAGNSSGSTSGIAGNLAAAGDNGDSGDSSGLPGGGSTGTTGGTANSTAGATSSVTACSNGKDDDGDGLIDGFDPECTGTADNDEGTFATGIPGDNRDPKWQDCFFDGNSGAGDDHCRYATGCLTGALQPDDPDCKVTAACIKFCAPLVPNGCDCFGCCTVRTPEGESLDISTSASCSLSNLNDEKACPRCVKSDVCGNTCGRCELCPGKTEADLPADCVPPPPVGTGGAGSGGTGGGASGGSPPAGGGPAYTCDGGEAVCGPDLPGCGLTMYCAQGCCIPQPPR